MGSEPEHAIAQDAGTHGSHANGSRRAALSSVSLISALLTIFMFLKEADEVVGFMLEHVGLSVAALGLLILLFAGDLIPRLAVGLWSLVSNIWRSLLVFLRQLPGRKLLSYGRIGIAVLALLLVIFSIGRVYISGVYYALLESSRDEEATSLQVANLNSLLAEKGSNLRVELTPPLGRSDYFAITVGPIFVKSEADAIFAELQQTIPVRDDANVKKVTMRGMWRKAVGVFR